MAVQICGYCGQKCHFTPSGTPLFNRNVPRDAQSFCEQSVTCDSCGRMSVFYVDAVKGVGQKVANNQMLQFWNENDPTEWWPCWVEGQSFDDVPDHISAPASEAHRVFSIGAVRSAVLMSRAVIEASCKDKGITSGLLASKINAMHNAGHIDAFTKEVAHTIRTFGNDMAHGDFIVDLDKEDAREVLVFMDNFLLQVYQLRARLSRLQTSSAARQAASNPSP